jgi:hypothetical protein
LKRRQKLAAPNGAGEGVAALASQEASMRFTRDRCLVCGTPVRPDHFSSPYPLIDSKGTHRDTDFWFCSKEHYEKALSEYIPKEYAIDNEPQEAQAWKQLSDALWEKHGGDHLYEDSPESINRQNILNEAFQKFSDNFYHRQSEAKTKAQIKLRDRLVTEARIQREEQEEKERIAREKEQAKAEQERVAAEAEIERTKSRPIPFTYRFDHTHVIAGSGHGKSTLLIKQFIDDIQNPISPALVVIDPKGTMVDQLRKLNCFRVNENPFYMNNKGKFPHLIIIDPTLFPPALNMFAPPKRKYAPNIQQQIENNAISLFQYIFVTKGSALTDKQMTCFSFAVPLILSIPNATIHTLLDLMSDKPIPKTGGMRPDSPFKPFIDKLGPTAKRFFYDSFYDISEYGSTKDQIATRIFGILRYPAFDAMFSTTENKLDMFNCLQKGKVVLISSPKSVLGTEGSKIFSRYMVALTLQAAFERITIDKSKWHPAFLIIDEAQDVMDEVKTPELLEQAREFKLGVTIAHQDIKSQLPEALFSSISANTRIKYAGTRSHMSASMMARDMHCEPEFITSQKVGQFACFVGGMTDHPFSVQLKLGEIDDYNMMSSAEFNVVCKCLAIDFGVSQKAPEKRAESVTTSTPEIRLPASSPEADKPVVAQVDPNKPAPWKRK